MANKPKVPGSGTLCITKLPCQLSPKVSVAEPAAVLQIAGQKAAVIGQVATPDIEVHILVDEEAEAGVAITEAAAGDIERGEIPGRTTMRAAVDEREQPFAVVRVELPAGSDGRRVVNATGAAADR